VLISLSETIEPQSQTGARHMRSQTYCWWRGTVVERRSLANLGEISLSCARPAADG